MKQLTFPGFSEIEAKAKPKRHRKRSAPRKALPVVQSVLVPVVESLMEQDAPAPESLPKAPLHSSNELRPLEVPLLGTSLIEASAGTGKTYAITTLFLRLLLERSLNVSEILVVTYTRAATAELRDRIRRRLRQALKAMIDGGDSADQIVDALVKARIQDGFAKKDILALTVALRSFDQASIFTIHSFCQRVLQDSAFESGASFETSFLTEEAPLISEICNDYWSKELYQAEASTVRYLLRSKQPINHKRIVDVASKAIRAAGVEILPQQCATPDLVSDWVELQSQARAVWESQKDDILTILTSDRIKKNHYKIASVRGAWADGIDRTLGESNVGIAPHFDKFAKFTSAGVLEGVKKGKEVPQHTFFLLCDALLVLSEKLAEMKVEFLVKLAEYARQEIALRKRELGVESFDDLLQSVALALQAGSNSPLAHAVRNRFPAALIDEFQDTDPVQYGVFRTVYSQTVEPTSLFLIGDPKQAIYGFRGADIFAYMAAREDAGDQRYSLGTNWRSDPSMVAAVNTLFTEPDDAFVFEKIKFESVKHQPTAQERLEGGLSDIAAIDIMFVRRPDGVKKVTKAWANRKLPEANASAIAALLTGTATIDGKSIVPGDIAVLVRKNAQAQHIQNALRLLSIPSVIEGDSSVFDTAEAVQLGRVLAAVVEPTSVSMVVSAITSAIFGVSGNEVSTLHASDSTWDCWNQQLRTWYRIWMDKGFIQAYRELLSDEDVIGRILKTTGGERVVTNLFHLGELLQTHSMATRCGPQALVRWFRLMRVDKNARLDAVGDSGQIRLESDEDAVRIVTIHKSKGLEYPVVFCPYLWDGSLMSKRDATAFTFHDSDSDGRLLLDLGSDELARHHSMASREVFAENVRLLYVALTRAKHRCYLTWGGFSSFETSPLGYLLHQPAMGDRSPEGLKSVFRAIADKDDRAMLADIESLVNASNGSISLRMFQETSPAAYRHLPKQFEWLSCHRAVRKSYSKGRFSSFTALTHQRAEEGEDRDVDRMDRMNASGDESAASTTGVEHKIVLVDFPKGARVGIMIHHVFEHLDFGRCNDSVYVERQCSDALQRFGFEATLLSTLSRSIQDTCQTPLLCPKMGGEWYLSEVSEEHRIDEMEFLFPVHGKREALVDGEALAGLLARYQDSPWSIGYMREVAKLKFQPLQGYMRGFIDLVFCRNDIWYIADYKSNFLGDTSAHYRGKSLTSVMTSNHYYLQYLIYLVALHRYLSLRLPNYDYDLHVGGVYYFFVRGMSPDHSLGDGVFSDRPPKSLIEELSALFSLSESSVK